MYRQQPMPAAANAPVHPWYTGYHQQAQIGPSEQQMWEQQVWHTHHPHAHGVFPGNDFSEFVGHHPVIETNHNQLMPSPTITVSGSELSSPGGTSGNISPPNNVQTARPPPARSPYEWIKKTSYQTQPNPGELNLLCLLSVSISIN